MAKRHQGKLAYVVRSIIVDRLTHSWPKKQHVWYSQSGAYHDSVSFPHRTLKLRIDNTTKSRKKMFDQLMRIFRWSAGGTTSRTYLFSSYSALCAVDCRKQSPIIPTHSCSAKLVPLPTKHNLKSTMAHQKVEKKMFDQLILDDRVKR
jgi:hypothetical protein